MEEGQNCACDFTGTCIERCKEGLECLGPYWGLGLPFNPGTCTKTTGETVNQFILLDLY